MEQKEFLQPQDLQLVEDNNKDCPREIKPQTSLIHKEVKWVVGFLCTAIFALLTGILVVNGRFSEEFNLKAMQINSLIDEIGYLKGENYEMYLNQKVSEMDMKQLNSRIVWFNNGITTNDQTAANLEKTKKQMVKARDDLNKMNESRKKNDAAMDFIPQDQNLDILLLGMNGSLTDTIMIVDFNFENKKINLISIPRDLYLNGRKINEIYKSYGVKKMSAALYEVTGILLDHYAALDLKTFVKIVDSLGGIDVVLEKDLADPFYPGPNYTYELFSLAKGERHLDGETALKYVRSRKTSSDFDRMKRQHQVIQSIWQRLKDEDFLNDLEKARKIFFVMKDDLETDIDLFRALGYLKDGYDFKFTKVEVLSTGNYLYSTYNEGGQYILLPKKGDFREIREYVKKVQISNLSDDSIGVRLKTSDKFQN